MKTMTSLLAAAMLAVALTAPPAEAKGGLPNEPQGFTLEVALARAMRNNPAIQMAEARVTQARLEKESADLWWARSLRGQANYNVLGSQAGQIATVTPDGTVLPTAAIGVGVNLGDLLAGPKTAAISEQNVLIAEAELKRTTLDVANQVTTAYHEYQAAKMVAGFSDEAVEAAETDVKVMERSFARGATMANQLVGARLAVHRVKADTVASSGNVVKAWANLLTVIADPSLSIAPASAPATTTADRR